MLKNTSVPVQKKNYCPSRNLIGMVSNKMSEYRLPEDEAIETGVCVPDTGVIILIILYFIDKEPKISTTKLEYYILLLDRYCFDSKGVTLFNWKLSNGHIPNFKKFIAHMIKKGLITFKGRYSFEIKGAGQIVSQNFAMLCNIEPLLKEIVSKWHLSRTDTVKTEVRNAKSNSNYMQALENVRRAIEKHTQS